VREALQSVLHLVTQAVPSVRETVLAPDGLETWCVNQRLLQALEFGQTFAEWIDRCNPTFSFEVASSLVRAAALNESDVTAARLLRASVRARLDEMLGSARVLCLPTSPILPILRTARLSEMRQAVDRIVHLTCIAGLTGLPQVSLPLAASGGIPVGLSLIGPRGGDRMLLAFARRLAASATTFTA
jgi:amidase